MNNTELINNHLKEAGEVIASTIEHSHTIDEIAKIAISTLKSGGTIFWCGNGGSAADSQHLAAELIGRYKVNRAAFSSIALTTDTSAITAIGNDFGFEKVFSRQLEGLANSGDLLIALSTSGDSRNIVEVLGKAREIGVVSALLTSEKCKDNKADYIIRIKSKKTELIQHAHTAVGHVMCEIIEKELAKES